MSQDIYSQYLRWKVTESAASTFTEGDAILTGASVNRVQNQNIALEIHAIGVNLSLPADAEVANTTESVTFCLSTRSGLTAMPNLDEEHVIFINQTIKKAGVATYLPFILDRDNYLPRYVEFKYPILISHPKIYPYLVSSNAAATSTCYGFMLFTYVLLDADLAIEALEAFR